ncbi:MAG TPA: hypothetical protein VEQ34_08395, partial [Pyrinomonadaceae bacterium]|nr:hypothetical protein [Pyrinomonadaceae bacterium]
MFSSNPPKLFSLVLFFSICFSACGFWTGGGAGDNSNGASQTPFNAREIPTEIPFSTREPEVFQCEIVVSGFTGGEKMERKTFVARNGARRLTVFGSGEKTEISLLQIDAGAAFSIYQDKKVYTESVAGGRASLAASNGDFGDFLTTGWLNAKANAAFENLGAENGLSKYLVRLNNSDAS